MDIWIEIPLVINLWFGVVYWIGKLIVAIGDAWE